jgi:hypothetical protein
MKRAFLLSFLFSFEMMATTCLGPFKITQYAEIADDLIDLKSCFYSQINGGSNSEEEAIKKAEKLINTQQNFHISSFLQGLDALRCAEKFSNPTSLYVSWVEVSGKTKYGSYCTVVNIFN